MISFSLLYDIIDLKLRMQIPVTELPLKWMFWKNPLQQFICHFYVSITVTELPIKQVFWKKCLQQYHSSISFFRLKKFVKNIDRSHLPTFVSNTITIKSHFIYLSYFTEMSDIKLLHSIQILLLNLFLKNGTSGEPFFTHFI